MHDFLQLTKVTQAQKCCYRINWCGGMWEIAPYISKLIGRLECCESTVQLCRLDVVVSILKLGKRYNCLLLNFLVGWRVVRLWVV